MSLSESTELLRVVFVTAPSAEAARSIARVMIDERLAACVSTFPGVRSTYRWQGKVEEADEVFLMMKTVQERLPALAARIKELHPYNVPEVIALPVEAALPSYAAWVVEETRRVIV